MKQMEDVLKYASDKAILRLRRDCRHSMTPQRLSEKGTRLPRQGVMHDASTSELQKHLGCDVLLACAATRSQSCRSDRDENTAAATARKK